MKVIITMAGEGSRFKVAGFDRPKYEIEALGKPLFDWSMISLRNFFESQFIFITRSEFQAVDFLRSACQRCGISDYRFIELDQLTGGQADSALLARSCIDDTEEAVLIYNIDTFTDPKFLTKEDIRGDGWLPAFTAEGTKWSFVEISTDDHVTKVTEKERISSYATIGLYYFKSFKLFEEAAEAIGNAGYKEKYIAPLYNYLIKNNFKVFTKVLPLNAVQALGTPEDLEVFKIDNLDEYLT